MEICRGPSPTIFTSASSMSCFGTAGRAARKIWRCSHFRIPKEMEPSESGRCLGAVPDYCQRFARHAAAVLMFRRCSGPSFVSISSVTAANDAGRPHYLQATAAPR